MPLSTGDFPGRLSAVVFCQGCPWRCAYCHNPHLQPRRSRDELDWQVILDKLGRRTGLLDAVVFSGGEPTAQAALPDAMQRVRELDFRVGLHTAGPYPKRLARLLPLVDWVGLDMKTHPDAYDALTGANGSAPRALDSVCAVLESGVDYEVRTTVHPDLVDGEALLRLARALARLGVKRYVVQEFRATGCADHGLAQSQTPRAVSPVLCREIGTLFESFEVRAA